MTMETRIKFKISKSNLQLKNSFAGYTDRCLLAQQKSSLRDNLLAILIGIGKSQIDSVTLYIFSIINEIKAA